MILMAGDRILDLQAHTYAPPACPYIPFFGINHEMRGACEGAAEAWLGFGDPKNIVWDFTWYSFDTLFWRLMHTYTFWGWNKFVKKLEAEMQSDFAKSLQVSPFEQAVIDSGVEVNKSGVSPETERELMHLVAQAGGQMTPALFGKMSPKARQELQVFTQQNQAGLRSIAQRMGVKL